MASKHLPSWESVRPEQAVRAAKIAAAWTYHNPVLAGCGIVALTGVGLVAAPGVASGAALSAAGFGAGGVKAGSLAAAVQSTIGNVAGGSLFAASQSAAAGGAGAAVVNGAVQLTGSVLAGGGGVATWFRQK